MNEVTKSQRNSHREAIRSINPREAYELIKSHRRGSAPVEQVDVDFSGLAIFDKYVPKDTETFYVAAMDEMGAAIDAGVIARPQYNPEFLVFSPMDAVSKHTLESLGEPGARGVHFRERGLILEATLEDCLKFGSSWSRDERDYVLQEAVKDHYQVVGHKPRQIDMTGAKLVMTLPPTPREY